MISDRVKEHISDIKNGHVSNTALCEDTVWNPANYIWFDKPQILAKENRYIPRMIGEAIELQKHPNFNREDGWKLSTTSNKPTIPEGKILSAHATGIQGSTRGN